MDYIGFDSDGRKLQLYDICRFKVGGERYEGIITYDEDVFCYIFEMDSDTFPAVLMVRVDERSIEKIRNVFDTKQGDRFEFYRDIYKINQKYK